MTQLEPIGSFKNLNFEKQQVLQTQNEEENYFVNNSSNGVVLEDVQDEEKFNFRVFLEEAIHSIKEFFGFKDTNYENSDYSVNGIIYKDFQQGLLGDCSLLGTLYSLSNTEEGAKIIKEAITINENFFGKVESYDVYFKGIDEIIAVTKDELETAEEVQTPRKMN